MKTTVLSSVVLKASHFAILIFSMVFLMFLSSISFADDLTLTSCNEKTADGLVYETSGSMFFVHPNFRTMGFRVELECQKIRVKGGFPFGKTEWVDMKQGGEACYKWGLIGGYKICVSVKGDTIGIYDNGGWSYTSLVNDGTTQSGYLNLAVTTSEIEGYISINNSNPLKIWHRAAEKKVAEHEAEPQTVTVKSQYKTIEMRAEPSMDKPVIENIPGGMEILKIGENPEWVQVKLDMDDGSKLEGWVKKDMLVAPTKNPANANMTSEHLNGTAGGATSSISGIVDANGTISGGSGFTVSSSEGTYRISFNQPLQKIVSCSTTVAGCKTMPVTISQLNETSGVIIFCGAMQSSFAFTCQ